MANDVYTNLLEKTINDMMDNPSKVVQNLEDRMKEIAEELIAIRKIIRKIKKTPDNEKADTVEQTPPVL